MRTTIDGAGRIVIPKALRERAGFAPGSEVDVVESDGRIEIQAVAPRIRLVERDGVVAAERDEPGPELTVEQVREVLERVRR